MRVMVYTIFDTASGAAMRPFFSQGDGAAIREFSDLAVSADHPIGKHPEDYSLFRIGQFDDNKITLIQEDKECLITGLEAVAASRQIEHGSLKEVAN